MDHISRIELPVKKGFVHIYSCKLAGQQPHIAEYGMVLSEAELARTESYKSNNDKNRYVLAHLFLRNVLSRYTGTSAASIRFLPSHYYNRPLLSSGEVQFSLSYRGNWALLAISPHLVGADIEQHREIENIDDFATDFFSEKERLLLSQKETSADKHAFFFRLWTLKEAYIKAISKGLTYPLTEFSILPGDDHTLLLESPYRKEDEWHFKTLATAPGYAAAIAFRLDY